MKFTDTRPTFVYRCFDADGRLLYVGCSVDPKARVEQHRANSWWADRLTSFTQTEFPDRWAALDGERVAIYNERPACNVKSRWYQLDPRSDWSLVDYANYRAAVVRSANGVAGPATARLLHSIETEARSRFLGNPQERAA